MVSIVHELGFNIEKIIENTRFLGAPPGRCERRKRKNLKKKKDKKD